MISLIVICPSWLPSPAGHAAISSVPNAMFTMVTNSCTATLSLVSQSPGHDVPGVGVGPGGTTDTLPSCRSTGSGMRFSSATDTSDRPRAIAVPTEADGATV